MYNFSNVTTLYVSAKYGSDHNMGFCQQEDGLGNGPVKTFQRALELTAELRRAGMKQPLTLKIMDEWTDLTETVRVDEAVSDLTIEPLDREKRAVITGSRKITGFYETEYNGHRCFAARIPETADGSWSFTDLYVDGERADRPRYPDTGYLIPKEVEIKDKALNAGSKWFIANDGDLDEIEDITECGLTFTHFWVDEHTPIEAFDRETNKVTMKFRSRFHVYSESPSDRSTMEYYLEGVKETFGKPNQWFLDKKDGILYYIPKNENQTISDIQVYAPVISTLFDVCGSRKKKVSHISFRDIDFCYTSGEYYSDRCLDEAMMRLENKEARASDSQSANAAPGTIRFRYAYGCSMEHCAVTYFGHYGASVEEGCRAVYLENNRFFQGGAGGIKVNGASVDEERDGDTCGIVIKDNEISFCGRKYFAGCGILLMHTYENVVVHNTIHDLYYTGISVGWVWGYHPSVCRDNRIEKNHIYNLGDGPLSDMAGIYTLGPQPGTIIRGNHIHDVIARHYGGNGIYTDEGSSYITVEDNICYRVSHNVFNQHYGCMNTVRNNIFAFGGEGVLKVCRPEMHVSAIFERNIAVNCDGPIYALGFNGHFSNGIGASKNLFFDYGRDEVYMLEGEAHREKLEDFRQAHSMDVDSRIGDPLFADALNGDFRLAEESPAKKLGFCPFDLSDAGVR